MKFQILKKLEGAGPTIPEPVCYDNINDAHQQAICSMGRGFDVAIHVYLEDGEKLPHAEAANCWCDPEVVQEQYGTVVVHRGLEG